MLTFFIGVVLLIPSVLWVMWATLMWSNYSKKLDTVFTYLGIIGTIILIIGILINV